MLINTECADDLLAAYKAGMDDGKLLLCAGAVPTDASDALDLTTTHTILATITANAGAVGSGDGLDWEAPSGGVMLKPSGDTWSSAVPAFTGYEATGGTDTLTATFLLWLPREADPEDPADTGEVRAIFGVGPGSEFVIAGGTSVTEGGDPKVITYARLAQSLGAVV